MAVKLFVGSLSWDTTDAALEEFFSQAGTVVSASVISDRETGRSRGFGFVEMSSQEGAEKARQLSGQTLDGRSIIVSEARPQEPRQSGGGGGFRRDDRGGRGGGRDRRY